MKETVTSLKLAVMLLAVNIVISVVSFTTHTNNQQVYAQSIDDANSNDDDDNNNNSISFIEPINLTNNTRDSVYAQIASHGENVYMVWQENNPDALDRNNNVDNNIQYNNNNYRNYDIYIKKSTDGGLTFSKEINLSKNPGFSEHPQIAISGNNVYVAWIDDASSSSSTIKNQEIYFRKSIDGGNTFDEIINLSNSSNADSYNLEITAAGNNVYVVWQDTTLPTADVDTSSSSSSGGGSDINADNNSDRSSISTNENSSILFRASTDDGNTFKKIKSLSNSAFKSYPKIAAFENSAYVVWNVGIIGDSNSEDNNAENINNGIFFTKSFDSGDSFSDTIKLNSNRNSIGESQIAAYGNNVYVVWGGNPDEKVVGDIFFVKSTDNGNRFAKAVSLGEPNSLNVEIIADGNNNVYIAWQALLSADYLCPSCLLKPEDNEEILFKKSSDKGATFTNIYENISKNEGISECTSIAVSENNNVYVAWEDYTYGNHEILFSKSI
jgi:hypothetical protein